MRHSGLLLALSGFALTLLGSCSKQTDDRNVIMGHPPFFRTTITYKLGDADKIVDVVQTFADRNAMDFVLARAALPNPSADFNAQAAGATLNLKAIHTSDFKPEVVEVFAISSGSPTTADEEKAREFACAVGGPCRF